MYEQFSDEARQVMLFSHMEARRLKHEYVGTEHILLGLVMQNSGIVSDMLEEFTLDLDKVRREVQKIVQEGPETSSPPARIPQTPRCKKVIEFAIEEAWEGLIGAGHLLLGLLRESEGVAYQVLLNVGVSVPVARGKLLQALARSREAVGGAGHASADSNPDVQEADSLREQVSEYLGQIVSTSPIRFTGQVREIIWLANQVATRLQHEYVSPEHILWGLLKQISRVLVVIANMRCDHRRICQDLETFLGPGVEADSVAIECLKSPSPVAKSVLDAALQEACALKHSHAGPEHVLLGLLRPRKAPPRRHSLISSA